MNSFATIISTGKKVDDWLSPILVKELRQGMRARVFIAAFLLLQVFLVVLVLGNLAAQDDRYTLDYQNRFFWGIIGFALLALMPLRGLTAVSVEVKNQTMETIMLTRLTAWRVVFGKWSALFAQSLLLVSAVLPYIVLRYFIGGDDVVSDFEWILFLLWMSGLLIAASIAVSALGNAVMRIVILVAVISMTSTGLGELFNSSPTRGGPWEVLGWLLIFGLFVPALLFELTATGIAPASENHAIRRRLLAVGFFLAAYGLYHAIASDFQAGVVVPLFVLIGICYFDLAEKPRLLPRMIQPLARRGIPGKIAALFLLPGWPTALLISLVVIPTATALVWEAMAPRASYPTTPSMLEYQMPLAIFSIFGSVLTPILICHLLWPRMNQVLLMVLLYNIALMLFASVIEGFASLMHASLNDVLFFMPGLPVMMTNAWSNANNAALPPWFAAGNAATLTVLLLVLFGASFRYFRALFAQFRAADQVASPPETREPGATTT